MNGPMSEPVSSSQAQGQNAAAYRVLARKYRPKTFADLIGQDALVRTLTNAFATGRVAQAYMLTGVRGVGKTTTARLIARALNYPSGPTIDMPEITPQCEAILESRHMDVIEMDAASNTGVDNMREIIDSVRYAPVSVRTKVYIIDEVHMLSKSAFNALLKTLEEPPPHVKFIFATTEIRKVPVTILSRCQRFDLKRFDVALLMQLYGKIAGLENVEIDEDSLRMIARAAEGSARDGLSLLDQAIVYGEGKVVASDVTNMLGLIGRTQAIDLFEAVMAGDGAKALDEISRQYDAGGDPVTILADLADFTHWVTRLKVVRASALADHGRTEDEKTRGAALADRIGMAHLTRAWQMLLKGHSEAQFAHDPLAAAEMVVLRLCHGALLPQGEELAKLARQNVDTGSRPAPSAVVENMRREVERTETRGDLALAVSPPTSSVTVETTAPQALNTFMDIVSLATTKRDVKLKSELERFVRPVKVSDGRLEMALETGAPPQLANELMRKLQAWTGKRWMVSLSQDKGAEPLAKVKRAAQADAKNAASEDSEIKAILKAFPGSEITDVRLPQTADISPPPTEDSDEESQ
jgi:DNA polymerase III subunit gamma/tau